MRKLSSVAILIPVILFLALMMLVSIHAGREHGKNFIQQYFIGGRNLAALCWQ